MNSRRIVCCLGLLIAGFHSAQASSILHLSPEEQLRLSAGVFRGTVLEVSSYRDPGDELIYTRALVRVDEALKGKLPPVLKLVHRGGTLPDIGQSDGLAPRFRVGEERLIFVARSANGTVFATQGAASAISLDRDAQGNFTSRNISLLRQLRISRTRRPVEEADLTDQAGAGPNLGSSEAPSGDSGGSGPNGFLVDAKGVPARFITSDRGEPIPYLVDASYLPAGITVTQALTAISNACAAWSGVTSLKFSFAGFQNFGTAPPNIQARDGVIRIALHDTYNFIASPSVLGLGGSYFATPVLTNAGWGTGGKVAGTEFNQSLCGYVVIHHSNPALEVASTLEEVLCHEIGHVLGLGHSSEDPNEADPVLAEAIMYFNAHENGRGATLGTYDPLVAARVNPPTDPPPFSFGRVMDIVTSSGSLSGAGINQIDMRGYSLSSSSVTLNLTNRTSNYGAFSQAGSTLKYVPKSAYPDSTRVDPSGLSYYEIAYARHSEGSNASPYVMVRVISYSLDSFPNNSDGIPDNWMTDNFGAAFANPALGSKHHATDDADGDGLTNLQEYRTGMNPTKASSAQRAVMIGANVIQWQAKPYEVYELQGTTNFHTWTRIGSPSVPTTTTGIISNFANPALSGQFLRIMKVP